MSKSFPENIVFLLHQRYIFIYINPKLKEINADKTNTVIEINMIDYLEKVL